MSNLFDAGLREPHVNRLWYGDNLTIMTDRMKSRSVDLIYLDPPFNSNRRYNLLYSKVTGLPVPEQEEAFCDAWSLTPEKREMVRNMPVVFRHYGVDERIIKFWTTWIDALRDTQPKLLAYLVYMSYRLLAMRPLLRPSGSIWLHCDTTASHYIKIMMDGIFGHENFRAEVIWKRTSSHSDTKQGGKQPGRIHDVLLFYTKTGSWTWNPQYLPYDESYVDRSYRHIEGDSGRRYRLDNLIGPGGEAKGNPSYDVMGVTRYWRYSKERMQELIDNGRVVQTAPGRVPAYKRYLDEMPGVPLQDIWTDIGPIASNATERLGYPTQKPVALLDRIIRASSNEGDVVFDPFCGCGTTIFAAHLAKRSWIGCDIAWLSVGLVRDVLKTRYGLKQDRLFALAMTIRFMVSRRVSKVRESCSRATRTSSRTGPLSTQGGFCSGSKSGDRGVDGRIHFETGDGLLNMVLSVKGGRLQPAFVRELVGVLAREEASKLAGFICLENPTPGMLREAAEAGVYEYQGKPYERLQIRTIDQLLDGRGFDTPTQVRTLDWMRQAEMVF